MQRGKLPLAHHQDYRSPSRDSRLAYHRDKLLCSTSPLVLQAWRSYLFLIASANDGDWANAEKRSYAYAATSRHHGDKKCSREAQKDQAEDHKGRKHRRRTDTKEKASSHLARRLCLLIQQRAKPQGDTLLLVEIMRARGGDVRMAEKAGSRVNAVLLRHE